jgi:hypothetical protein
MALHAVRESSRNVLPSIEKCHEVSCRSPASGERDVVDYNYGCLVLEAAVFVFEQTWLFDHISRLRFVGAPSLIFGDGFLRA